MSCSKRNLFIFIYIVLFSGASVLGEVHRKTDTWVDCEHTKDLSKFANCAALKRTEKCKAYSEKMRYYCPVTCGFCNGKTLSGYQSLCRKYIGGL